MNLYLGGKQLIMHDAILQNGTVQSMVFRYGDREWNSEVLIGDELLGKPKGIKRTLRGRGLWREDLKKQCAREKESLKATTQVPPTRKGVVSFEERQFHKVLEEYETRTVNRCKTGKDCCALRILEAQPDFANEVSLLTSGLWGWTSNDLLSEISL